MSETENTKQENIDLFRKWLLAVNSHDTERIEMTLDENYIYSFPNGSNDQIKGKADDLIEWKKFFEGISHARFEEKQLICENVFVVAVLRMTGINTGPLNIEGMSGDSKISPTNKKIEIVTCGIYTIKKNKILKLVRYWDSAELLKQIGN